MTFTPPAMAEAISKQDARAYYKNCKTKADPIMSAETQKLLCACTAVQMHEKMEKEDIADMKLQNKLGREATNKMLINTYAPCMQYPAKELYFQNCISDPQTQAVTKNPQKTCTCLSDRVAQYLSTRGVEVFRSILSRNPNITDPMSALANDDQFKNFTQTQLASCLK